MSSREHSMTSQAGCGLLLVGHGSREQPGLDEFRATVHLAARKAPGLPIEPAFLEFAEPTIADGFRALAERGVRRIVVVPVLLFSAAHAQQDIPRAVARVAAEYPEIGLTQTDHLGCHQKLLALSKLRFDEALDGRPRVPPEQTALVMVGRGSHDCLATAEMAQLALLRGRMTTVALARAAFIAMAEPRLETVLDEIAATRATRIVVQPHLLFGGVLLDRIGEVVERFAVQHPDRQWVTTGHLGAAPLLVEAILDRAAAAQPASTSSVIPAR